MRIQSHVYTHKPRTLSDMKEAIREEVATIDREMLECVYNHMSILTNFAPCMI